MSATDTRNTFAKLRDDPRAYIEPHLRIKDKAQRLIPLKFNPVQERVYQRIAAKAKSGKPPRFIILKARQQGISTLVQALIFHAVATRRYAVARVIAHEKEPATELFEISRLFYDELPPALKPMRRYSTQRSIVFDNPKKDGEPGLRSRIQVETAQDQTSGRSSTTHYLHCSEVAYWPYAKETMISLMSAVPDLPNTLVVLESTANGVGGHFYEEYQRAKRGDSEFEAIFLPWHEFPEYATTPDPDMRLTPEERRLQERFGLSLEQLAWRRWCISANCGGDPEMFAQEYPSDDREAFRVSGRPYFYIPRVEQLKDQAASTKFDTGNLKLEDGHVKFVPDDGGFVTIFKHPVRGAAYVIGADASEGLAHGDYSAANVLDRNLRHVARWHGHLPADEFGYQLYLLGRYYNDALIGPEANNHGLTTITKLRELEYHRIYRRMVYDTIEQAFVSRLGWATTSKTRPLMLDQLARVIRDGSLQTSDERLLDECLTFVRKANGKAEAQRGAFDDLVISLAIAVQVLSHIAPDQEFEDDVPATTAHIERLAAQYNRDLSDAASLEDW